MNTTLHQNRPEDTQNWTNLYLEPHNYQIHYVNIDLHYQHGISVAESQTFLLTKRPQRQEMSKRKIKQEVGLVLLFELFSIGKCKTDQSN